MADLPFPAAISHNNPLLPIVRWPQVEGGPRVALNRAELYSWAANRAQLIENLTLVRVVFDDVYGGGSTTLRLVDIGSIGNADGWELEKASVEAGALSLLTEFGQDPPGFAYVTGDLRRGYVTGATEQQIFRRKAPGGAAVAPAGIAGNANWEHVNAADAPQPPVRTNWTTIDGLPDDNPALVELLSQFATTALLNARIPAAPSDAGPYHLTAASGVVSWQPYDGSGPVATAPGKVGVLALTPGNGQMGLTFPAVDTATSYTPQYRPAGVGAFTNGTPSATLPLVVSGLTNGSAYDFRAYASNAVGDGAVSDVVSGTPNAVPVITSFTPSGGVAGAVITLTGTNFIGVTSGTFDGQTAVVSVTNATTATLTVPAAATNGLLTLTNPGVGTATSPNIAYAWGALATVRVDDTDGSQRYVGNWPAASYSLGSYLNGQGRTGLNDVSLVPISIFTTVTFAGAPGETWSPIGQVDNGSPYKLFDNGVEIYSNPGTPGTVGPPGSGTSMQPFYTTNYLLTPGQHVFEVRKLVPNTDFVSGGGHQNTVFYYDGFEVKTRYVAKGVHLIFDGNSIIAGLEGTLDAPVAAALQALLVADGDTRPVSFSNVAISGQTTTQMRANGTDADAAFVVGKDNILLAGELYNEFRPSPTPGQGLDATVTDPAAIAAKVASGIATVQGYFQDRRAAKPYFGFVVGSPGPDKYNGAVTPYAPPRADFYTAIQVPVRNGLQLLLSGGTAAFNAIADVTSDTVFDPSDPAMSPDGVHPNDNGLRRGYIISRYAAAAYQVLTGKAQPAPLLALPAGAVDIVFGADNAAIGRATDLNNFYVVAGSGVVAYGNTSQSGRKLAGAGCFGHQTTSPAAVDAVLLITDTAVPTGYAASKMGLWNSGAVRGGTGTLYTYDSAGTPAFVDTLHALATGDMQAIFRLVNPNADGLDRFVLRLSTNNGVSWTDLYTYTYTVATGTSLYLGLDLNSGGLLSRPFAIGSAPV